MKNAYFYLYFRLYKFAKRIGTVDATWTGMLLVSVLLFFNFNTVLLLTNMDKIFFLSAKITGAAMIFSIGVLNYFIFIWKGKCFAIISEFKNESQSQKTISSLVTIVYIVLTWYFAHLD